MGQGTSNIVLAKGKKERKKERKRNNRKDKYI
jgi:hypothetical protein